MPKANFLSGVYSGKAWQLPPYVLAQNPKILARDNKTWMPASGSSFWHHWPNSR
jgi:hypothetical protein